jgi:ABC-type amino acid transport substrate-binding protein
MSLRGRLSMVAAVAVVVAACSSGGWRFDPAASIAAPSAAAPSVAAPSAAAPSTAASVAPIAGGLLDKIKKAGKLVVSTDPKYPPQSELTPDGKYEGFDIDVATEIAKRLGVDIEFTTPDWTAITAGGWGGRWDVSVGSMTITVDRSKVLDFSPRTTYTPAQMAASKRPGSPRSMGLPARPSAGEGTDLRPVAEGHARLRHRQTSVAAGGRQDDDLPTDTDCPRPVEGGRNDFEAG